MRRRRQFMQKFPGLQVIFAETALQNGTCGGEDRQLDEVPRHIDQHAGPHGHPSGFGAGVEVQDHVHVRHAEEVEHQVPQQAPQKQPGPLRMPVGQGADDGGGGDQPQQGWTR